jgi:membrane-associated phospholipid phosphatase
MELGRRSTWLVMGVFSSSNGVVVSHPSSKTGLQSGRMSQAEHPRDRSLAEVAAHRVEERRGRASQWSVALSELGAVDRAAYEAVTRTPTPSLDEPIRRLSNAANHSLLWLAIAALLALFGGERGRRAALDGVVAIGITSASVNLVTKSIVTRPRPERADPAPFAGREIEMPASPSFPSGHAASAFAFAYAVGRHLPILAIPIRLLAGAVAYSRVHLGVHYPGDVVVGSIAGSGIAAMVASAEDGIAARRRRSQG